MARGVIDTGDNTECFWKFAMGIRPKQRLNHGVKASTKELLDTECHSLQLVHFSFSSKCYFVLPPDTMSLIETWPLSPQLRPQW